MNPVKWAPIGSLIISLAGLGFSIAAFIRAGRREFRGLLRTKILEKLGEIRTSADAIAIRIEGNLTASTKPLTAQESHRSISVDLKHLEIKVGELRRRLPGKALEIFEAYNTWKTAMTGEGYPVFKKSDAFKPSDSRIANLQIAQTQFVSSLGALEDACLREKVPYWKEIPAKPPMV